MLMNKVLNYPPIAGKMARFFARVHQTSYKLVGGFAAASEKGLHPKHRLTRYHDFFVENVSVADSVLDVGCGNAALLKDVILKTKAPAVGVDISRENVLLAKNRTLDLPDVNIIHGDIFDYDEKRSFDAILLSNVLEHMRNRIELLTMLNERFSPKKLLIRVPMYEREWLVPYKKEIGVEWRLDNTHVVEYTEDMLRNELKESGMKIDKVFFRWGEIWAVAMPL
ncbi:class I SAM-dependent methyltransferase [Candidatus Omnitrophota bacterium]